MPKNYKNIKPEMIESDSDSSSGGSVVDEDEQEDVPALEEEDHSAEEEAAAEDDEPAFQSRKSAGSAGSKKSSNADDDDEDENEESSSSKRRQSDGIDRSNFIPSSVVPSSLRGLRACLLCALVKTAEQFEMSGCDNCEQFLQLRNNRSAVLECTSSSFDGLVMLMSPSESWVAKWLRWDRGCVPGAYAVSVTGQLPADIISELGGHGYRYVSRDTSLRA